MLSYVRDVGREAVSLKSNGLQAALHRGARCYPISPPSLAFTAAGIYNAHRLAC